MNLSFYLDKFDTINSTFCGAVFEENSYTKSLTCTHYNLSHVVSYTFNILDETVEWSTKVESWTADV